MQRIKLRIHGGGRLDVYGSLDAKRILIFLCRENFRMDDLLVARLIEALAKEKFTVARYESQSAVTTRLIERDCFRRLPGRIRQGLKALQLLFLPTHWAHFSARQRTAAHAIGYRLQSIRELIELLGSEKELIFLTRSAAGRIASLLADQTGIRKIVCLGYPFQHPHEGPDPTRYRHLQNLKTPLLIFQGTRDSYGGREIVGRYRFAANTSLEWVETDHNFELAEKQWPAVVARIRDFILSDEQPLEKATLSDPAELISASVH